ncbi:DUF5806 family protein [Halobaculum marinum]|uniref:DUF5806 family protein n=1 Tax=Halobaculum marinum TaxID=3031996 RepID=A0ABD5WUD0_9EURY|nr:DUF5806 family protein [Halobaculum sp. DT55]
MSDDAATDGGEELVDAAGGESGEERADAGTDTTAVDAASDDAEGVEATEHGEEDAADAAVDDAATDASAAEAGAPDTDEDDAADADGSVPGPDVGADVPGAAEDVPADVQKYDRFQKMERAEYDRVNEFLRDRTYVTAREWAIARLCADFRTETGVEMTKIGENLPRLVPFMTDTYTPQAVNQARAAFEEKVRKAGATFLYGAMSGFFTAEDLDDVMYESTEVAKFLLEVEGADLAVEEELAAEDKISSVMRDVREASAEVRGEEVKCPECGHVHES